MTDSKLGLSTFSLGALLLSGCVLTGVEPDEIDIADEGTSSGVTAGDGDPGGDGDGDSDTTGMNTGDGDGDGDPATGDGDPTTGDGDGDPTTGDPTTGDGDGDPIPCDDLEPTSVELGDTEVEVLNLMSSFESSCGSPGPEIVLSFAAPQDGTYLISFTSDAFDGVIYLVGDSCQPLDELACGLEAEQLDVALLADEIVHIIVDSDADFGLATVSVALQ